jgi:hypothetical protein
MKPAVIHFLASCVMQLSVHCTALGAVASDRQTDRQTDGSAMNRNGSGRKPS